MKKVIFSFAILAMVFMISCTKEGAVGPAGPAGTNGINGTNGTDGINGTNGTDGNANVHSFTYNITSANWTNDGLGTYHVVLNASAITQSILDYGAVLTYEYNNTYSYYVQMPYTTYYSSTVQQFLTPKIYVGGIQVNFDYSDFVDHGNPGDGTIKVVVIAGQTLNPKIDYKNYNEVKKYYNLPN